MKEKYFKYSLIGLIALLGWLIMSGLLSFVNGLLAAFTVYVLVNGQMTYLTEKGIPLLAVAAFTVYVLVNGQMTYLTEKGIPLLAVLQGVVAIV